MSVTTVRAMSAETFKRLDELDQPDSRNTGWLKRDRGTGELSSVGIAELHATISAIGLNASVPEHIQDHFLTAKHLALYAWYVYRFHMPAQLQAYGSLEYALKERIGMGVSERSPGLQKLLRAAIKQGLVDAKGIRDWPGHSFPPEEVPEHLSGDWLENLPTWLSYFRNDLAHGSFTLQDYSVRTLRIVADIINQLYA